MVLASGRTASFVAAISLFVLCVTSWPITPSFLQVGASVADIRRNQYDSSSESFAESFWPPPHENESQSRKVHGRSSASMGSTSAGEINHHPAQGAAEGSLPSGDGRKSHFAAEKEGFLKKSANLLKRGAGAVSSAASFLARKAASGYGYVKRSFLGKKDSDDGSSTGGGSSASPVPPAGQRTN